jgi:hypothetical protein
MDSKMKIDIFIVGGQKCGTTALHNFLSKHRNIKSGTQKEIDFFSYSKLYDKGFDYYHSLYKTNIYEKLFLNKKFIDASPSYLADCIPEKTVKRIYNYNKNAYIIILVRNPIERAFSAYNMYKQRFLKGRKGWWFDWTKKRGLDTSDIMARNSESYSSFENFIEEELKFLDKHKKIECSVIPQGKYIHNINEYEKVFKNTLVFSNEELNANTDSSLLKITQFLNIKEFKNKSFDGEKIFKGDYDEVITPKAFKILNHYYKETNNQLLEKYNVNYLK